MTTVQKVKKVKKGKEEKKSELVDELVEELVEELKEELKEELVEELKEELKEGELTMKETFDRMILEHNNAIKRNKEAIVVLRGVYKKYTLDVKNARKRKKSEGPPKMNGISKPLVLRDELYDFLSVYGVKKGDEVPRTKVVAYVFRYIKENGLVNQEKKTEFFPDARLKKLLGPARDNVDENDESKGKFYSQMRMQKYFNQYYQKA